MNLYYQNAPISEDDYSELSETFKIPFDVVSEVVAQIKKNGAPSLAQYTGVVRVRVEEMAGLLTTEPQSAPEALEPAPVTETQEIVADAATGLMRAMISQENDFFMMDEKGICKVNPSNPPSVEQSYMALNGVIKLGELKDKIEDNQSWMLGSMVSELENFHGENNFSVSQLVSEDTKSYNTVWTAREVYEAFKDKRYDVSFTHHKEVFFSKIPSTSKRVILKKCESIGFTSKQARDFCSIVKQSETDEPIKNIKTMEQGKDLIAVYKENKVKYYVYDNAEWKSITGLKGEVPDGMIVINTKEETVIVDGQEPVKIKRPSGKKGQ